MCVSAQASPISFTYEVDQPNYDVQIGSTVEVPVYFQEAVEDPDWSLLLPEDGLWSAGVLIERTDTSLGAPVSLQAFAPNEADFNDLPATVSVAADQATLFELSLMTNPGGVLPPETFPGSGVRRVLLGTLTIAAGATVGEVTTFLATDNTTDDTRTWTSFQLLDPDIESTSFTVTVVPEPATLALLALGGAALRRRR
jgi:hypothetical protein